MLRIFPPTKKLIILLFFTFLLFLYITLISPNEVSYKIYYLFNPEKSLYCYRTDIMNSLIDITEINPRRGKSIFFHETSCSSFKNGKIVIGPRQACAVESAALMNPNLDVYLLFTSPGLLNFENTQSDRYLRALQKYSNVKIMHLNYEKYTKGTPVEELYTKGKIDFSNYAQSHASDVLRYLTLYKYGGIYLDLDVVIVKSLENLPPNYAGMESEWNVAAGVLSFGADNLGKAYAKQCVDDLKYNFNGDEWGYNGPGVITRLLRTLCVAEKASEMLSKDCNGFKVYSPSYFYPIRWQNWTMYFDENYSKTVKNLTRDSYAIHVWNQHSKNVQVDKHSQVPYAYFAKKFCPTVYEECDSYL